MSGYATIADTAGLERAAEAVLRSPDADGTGAEVDPDYLVTLGRLFKLQERLDHGLLSRSEITRDEGAGLLAIARARDRVQGGTECPKCGYRSARPDVCDRCKHKLPKKAQRRED